MKKAVFSIIICLALFSCSRKQNFKSIMIGNQEWMAQNLAVTRFRNGDRIPEAKTILEWMRANAKKEPAWCYPLNNPENNATHGKLYNWYAVTDPRGIAPEGWHVPSDDEWKELTESLGGEVFAAYKLRTTADGSEQSSESGFSGLPSGGCKGDGSYFGFGSNGYWWTSTEVNDEFAWIRLLDYVQCSVSSMVFTKQTGFSVRCLKDRI